MPAALISCARTMCAGSCSPSRERILKRRFGGCKGRRRRSRQGGLSTSEGTGEVSGERGGDHRALWGFTSAGPTGNTWPSEGSGSAQLSLLSLSTHARWTPALEPTWPVPCWSSASSASSSLLSSHGESSAPPCWASLPSTTSQALLKHPCKHTVLGPAPCLPREWERTPRSPRVTSSLALSRPAQL